MSRQPQQPSPHIILLVGDEGTLAVVQGAPDAPLAIDAYSFIEDVLARMPGRLRLQSLTLERLGDNAPLATENLRMEADFEWLSNGAAKQMAEGK
jgi:hypothetical protein